MLRGQRGLHFKLVRWGGFPATRYCKAQSSCSEFQLLPCITFSPWFLFCSLNSQSLFCGHQECSVTSGSFRNPSSGFFQTLGSFLVWCLCLFFTSANIAFFQSCPVWEGLFCLHKQPWSHWTSKAKRTAMLWVQSSWVLVVCSLLVTHRLLITFSFFYGKMFAYSIWFYMTAIFSVAFLPLKIAYSCLLKSRLQWPSNSPRCCISLESYIRDGQNFVSEGGFRNISKWDRIDPPSSKLKAASLQPSLHPHILKSQPGRWCHCAISHYATGSWGRMMRVSPQVPVGQHQMTHGQVSSWLELCLMQVQER